MSPHESLRPALIRRLCASLLTFFLVTVIGMPSKSAPEVPPVEARRAVVNPATGCAYEVVREGRGLTWEGARDAAMGRVYKGTSGHLATLTSAEEVKFVAENIRAVGVLIGAYQDRSGPGYSEPTGGWRWVTSEPWSYTNWNGGEPNNANDGEDFAVLALEGKWNDYSGTIRSYLVEYDPSFTSAVDSKLASVPASPTRRPGARRSATRPTVPSPLATPTAQQPSGIVSAPKSTPLKLAKLPAVEVKRASYNPANGHHYETVAVAQPMTWMDAAAAAAARRFNGVSGHLATFSSVEETQFVASLLPRVGFWIGAYKDRSATKEREASSGWRWVTDEPWRYTNWNGGEPNDIDGREDFVVSTGPDGRWNDVAEPNGGYVVEYDTKSKPAGTTPSVAPHLEALQFLTKVRQKYQSFDSYSETIELRAIIDVYKEQVETARAEFTWAKPNLFRLVGAGDEGRVTAVGDGIKLFMIDRASPDMYVLRDMPSLGEALGEALRVMTDGFAAPVTLGFLDSSANNALGTLVDSPTPDAAHARRAIQSAPSGFQLLAAATSETGKTPFVLPDWVKTARLGEIIEGAKPAQAIYANLNIRYGKEPGIKAVWKLVVSLDDMLVRSSELRFRFDTYPLVVTETHQSIEINPKVARDEFEYSVPQNADRVKRLRNAGEIAP